MIARVSLILRNYPGTVYNGHTLPAFVRARKPFETRFLPAGEKEIERKRERQSRTLFRTAPGISSIEIGLGRGREKRGRARQKGRKAEKKLGAGENESVSKSCFVPCAGKTDDARTMGSRG